MGIESFRAPTMRAALDRVRRAAGADAVILESRQVSTDPPVYEVVARADDTAAVATLDPDVVSGHDSPEQPDTGSEAPDVPSRAGLLDELSSLRERIDRMNGWLFADTPPEFSVNEKHMHVRLVETGLDPRLAAAVIRRAPRNEPALGRAVWEVLADSVAVRGASSPGTRRVIALVGPTGVGKTTTGAKLAARAVLTEGRRVALITTDDRRVGAAAPLSFYADVLDVPFARVHSPEELARAVGALRDVDLVVIDTAGRSSRGDEDVGGLGPWLAAAKDIEPWLVLSAATGSTTNLDTLRTFARLEPEATIVTKLDEATRPGEVANVLIRSHLPLGYVATGPEIPDDLEPASRATLPRLLLDPAGP